MNILVFSWRDPKHPLAGGAEQVMHEHMKGWLQAGHSVTLFSSFFKGAKPKENLDGVIVIRKGSDILGVQLAAFIWYLFGKHAKYDFIVDQFHGLPFFTPLYSRLPKIAVIQEIAREVWMVNRLPVPFKWIIGFLGYISEPLFFIPYRRTTFITGSESAKKIVSKFGKIPLSQLDVVPHGVIIKAPQRSIPKEKKFTIVFLGIHSKDKGIEDAIKCFDLLKNTDFQFWTIGKFETPEYEKEIKGLLSNLKLANRVKMWGFVSQQEKFELLAKAHVLVNPSIYEGWGLVNIEANAMKTPIIAYNSPGLVDSVIHNKSGLIVIKNTPDQLANSIKKLDKNKSLLKKLQNGAYEWSKQFSWEKSKKTSLEIIEKLA